MKFQIIVIISLFLSAYPALAQDPNKRTAVFKQEWLKSLVSIEIQKDQDKAKPIGTGFLIITSNKHIALVTAKHIVFSNHGKGPLKSNLAYRLNDKKGKSSLVLDKDVTIIAKSGWIKSEKHDIACRLMALKKTTDFLAIPYSMFLPIKQIQAGAPLFIIGFPLGMRSEKYTTPVVRRATVARADPNNIIVDGFVFPGNSGGPVVYEPSIQLSKEFKTPILQGNWLVGMVLSYISYVETAISTQTGKPRVTFEDNAGLCKVIPADNIMDLLKSPSFMKIDKSLKPKMVEQAD